MQPTSSPPGGTRRPASTGSAAPSSRRVVLVLFLLTVALSGAVRFAGLGRFHDYVFDEHYYAHDAKVILDGRVAPRDDGSFKFGDELTHAHPPLGKLTIAAGILLFGDGPWGWRVPSALAGTALIALVYPLARRLRLPRVWALAATVLAAGDTLLIAESRIGVLDPFVTLWGAACVYCALRAVQSRRQELWLALCGVSAGLAVATKWSGLLALVAAVVVVALDHRRFFSRGAGRALALGLSCFVLVPLAVYLASYADYFAHGLTLGGWARDQWHMASFGVSVKGDREFASQPASWIFDVTPIWFKWAGEQKGTVGLLAIGNPLLWWGSLVALIALGVRAISRRDRRLGLAPLLVALLYLPWLATSRQAYIYYMAPVVPFMAILVATALARTMPAGGRVRCRWLPLGFVVGVAVFGGWYWLVGGLGAMLSGLGGWWPLPPVGVALAALVTLLVVSKRRATLRGALSWGYVGAVVGFALAYLPFLVGMTFAFEYYHRLLWFPTWR
jgi:dolichyl-phosphate-mannose-protein mannosyltransferase